MRVLLLRDFREEGWTSMDLVADMMVQYMSSMPDITSVKSPFPRFICAPGVLARQGAVRNATRLLNRFAVYPLALRNMPRADVYHIVDHSYAQLALHTPRHRTVVTCHDLDAFRCLIDPAQDPRPAWFRTMARHILRGLQQAARVLCVSGAVRDELERHRLVSPERLRVIHNGAHPTCTSSPDPWNDAEAARLLAGLPSGPTLLHVGSTISRKRIDILLRVFAAVRAMERSAVLVRVGGAFTPEQRRLADALGVADHIRVLPFLDRPVLSAVYRRATLVLQPSESEGFGLPLIEALACGTPVIASDLPVLREVGGDVARYCAVGDITGWAKEIRILLDDAHPAHRAERSRACVARAARFTWKEAARKIVQEYRGLQEQAGENVA